MALFCWYRNVLRAVGRASSLGVRNRQLREALAAERERLLEETREQQAFLRNVVDTVPGFVCVKGLGGRFVLGNRGLAEAYGTTTDGIVGKCDSDFNADPNEVAAFIEDDRQVIVERKVKRIAAEKFSEASGRERWLQTTKVPLVERDGSCSRLLAVAIDITEQRRLETELVQAQKLQSLGQLAGGIAHDFNNLLTAILGAADAAMCDLPPEAHGLRQCCSVITSAGHQAAKLTQQLLAFSRRSPLQLIDMDLQQTLDGVIALIGHTIDRRIRVARNFATASLRIRADVSQFQNAILNLACNARDAMPGGGVLTFSTAAVIITEQTCRETGWTIAPGEYVGVSVSDTGVGMDEETRRRMFEPFFTTKPLGRGTGLGLSAVYGMVSAHKGEVRVETALGKGTVVTLYLPRLEGPAHQDLPSMEVPRGSGRLLLVDDEPIVRAMTTHMLKGLGYDVVEAVDGVAAVETFVADQGRFDLVIMDLIMPRQGGLATFRALKRLRRDVLVLIASGFSAEREVLTLTAEGVSGFLAKPYRRAELGHAVRRALCSRASECDGSSKLDVPAAAGD